MYITIFSLRFPSEHASSCNNESHRTVYCRRLYMVRFDLHPGVGHMKAN